MKVRRFAFLGALGAGMTAVVCTHPATAQEEWPSPDPALAPSTEPAQAAPASAPDSTPAPPAPEPPSETKPPSAPTTASAPDPAPATSLGPLPTRLTPATPQAEATSAENTTTSSNSEAAALGARRPQYPSVVVGSGLFMFGVSYMAATMFAEASTARIDRLLYVPVAGPWLDLARRPVCSGTACNTEFGNRALLVTDGVLQDLGVLMTLIGLLSDHAPIETQTAKVVDTTARKVRVSPTTFGAGAYGVAAIGRF